MDKELKDPSSHLPLTDLSYQILLSLGSGSLHGYGILKAIADRSVDLSAPETGTLYTAIRRLGRDGLVEPSEAPTKGRRGRVYCLSRLGRRVLLLESHRLEGLVAEARALRLLDPTPEEAQ